MVRRWVTWLARPLGYDREINKALLGPAARGMLAHPWLLCEPRILRTVGARFRLLTGKTATSPTIPHLPAPAISLVGIGVSSQVRAEKK